jgi:hypothetical protein
VEYNFRSTKERKNKLKFTETRLKSITHYNIEKVMHFASVAMGGGESTSQTKEDLP